MVDQEIRVLGDENIIANPKNSQKQYPLTFKAVPNVIVYGRKKADLNFTVPITEGTNFNFNLERTAIIFSDSFNLEEYSYIMVKNPFEEISDFFYVSSLEELDPTGKEFNEFNDEVVKWLRRLVNIISNRCMIFETTLFKDLNNFPNIKSGQTFIRTEDGWTGITIRDINSELDLIFNKYVEEVNKKIQEHQVKMNELLEQWKQDIQKYAENIKQYEIVRVVTQTGHGFVFEPVMYSISQRKFVKAVFPHGADGVAVRIDDNNFRLVWAGRVEIPSTAKDTQQRDFVLGEYYFLGEGSNGGIQREKPDTYYQHLFQVQYSDELQQNIADVLLSVPINQKGKRWDIGEAKTTVNNIEELKVSDFPVDKVVEVLGYYKAGDGADHKRIIKAEDDGSGVQLSNNLWACIVHNGEVNVSWFGAKGDGVSDDTQAIQKALNYCEIVKGDINKSYLANSQIEVTKHSTKIYNFNLLVNHLGKGIVISNDRFSCKDLSIKRAAYYQDNGLSSLPKNEYVECEAQIYFNVSVGYCKIEKLSLGLCCIGIDGSKGILASTFDDIVGVATKNFIIIDSSYDANNITRVHSNPNIVGLNSNHNLLFEKIGTATFIEIGREDWGNISNCLCYGYKIAFKLRAGNVASGSANKIFIDQCHADVCSYFLYAENNQGWYISNCYGVQAKHNGTVDISVPFFYSRGITDCSIINFHSERIDGYLLDTSQVTYLGNVSVIASGNNKGLFNSQLKGSNYAIGAIKTSNSLSLNNVVFEYDKEILGKRMIDLSSNSKTINIFNSNINNFNTIIQTIGDIPSYELNINGVKYYPTKTSYDEFNKTWGVQHIKLSYTDTENINALRFNLGVTQKYISVQDNIVQQLNTLYHMEKMKQENVYDDYISYMDEKTLYDKQQRKLEQDRQLAYEEALKENPELTFEEFMSVQPMTLNLVEEPQPSEALKKFMDKYL